MGKGISNVQIENAIENIGDDDLDNNFVGFFSIESYEQIH